jgi:phosphoserine phosphatase
MEKRSGGLVVLDVDGVVLKGELLLALSREIGIKAFFRTLWNCGRYDLGRISLEQLLDGVYGQADGKETAWVWRVYHSMRLTQGSARAVAMLRQSGWKVLLISAGVPDFIITDLVQRLGADGGAGMQLDLRDGRLTGKVGGEVSRTGGKLSYVARLVRSEGRRWEDVAVVGDDRNNLPLMEKAGVSIGYQPMYQVRKRAQFIVDEPSLVPVADLLTQPIHRRRGPAPEQQHPVAAKPWHAELRRKAVHGTAGALPLLAGFSWVAVPALLIVASVLFLISEVLRLNGARFPVLSAITGSVIREHEKRELAFAPLTLVLGIIASLVAFEPAVAYSCVLIVAFADSAASVIGQRWGIVPIPYSRAKTLEGTAAFLGVSVLCGMVFLSPRLALVGGATAAFVESLDVEEWDNLMVPVAAGMAMQLAGW